MTYFLTSSPLTEERNALLDMNGFIGELSARLKKETRTVYVCSSPDEHELTELYGQRMRESFENSGVHLKSFTVLDGRNAREAKSVIGQSEFVILAGGHVPTQNRFFESIRLRELLSGFDGVLMGVSAGTMNCAATVYAQPELEGETSDPDYKRFIPGLGVTRVNIIPHYGEIKDMELDGLHVIRDITLPDSMNRTFYAIPDGSYVLGENGREVMRGEAYKIENGALSPFCENGKEREIK